MHIKADPGTERFIRYAKNRLEALRELRLDLRMPSLRKHHQPATDVLISSQSSDWEDYIRITGGAQSHYVVDAVVKDPDGVLHTTVLNISLDLKKVSTWSGATPINISVYPLHLTNSVYSQAIVGARAGYYKNGKFTAGFHPVSLFSLMKEDAVYRAQSDGRIKPVSTDIEIPGSMTVSSFVGFHSNGPKAISFYNPSGYEINTVEITSGVASYANEPVASFGDQTISYDYETTSDAVGGFGSGTVTRVDVTDYTATWPVCYALNAAGERQAITIVGSGSHVSSYDHSETVLPTGASGTLTSYNDSASDIYADRVEITLPNGFSKVHFLVNNSAVSSGEGSINEDGFGGATTSGSGTIARSDFTTDLQVLYADAAYPMIVYQAAIVSTSYSQTGITPHGFSVTAEMNYTRTTTTQLILLDGITEKVLEETVSVTTGSTSINVAGYIGGLTNTHSGGSATTPLDTDFYIKANRVVAAGSQMANKPTGGHYLGSFYSVADHANFINTSDKEFTSEFKTKIVNKVLGTSFTVDNDLSGYTYWFATVRIV